MCHPHSAYDRDDADLPTRASRTQGGSIGQAQAIPGRQQNPLPPQRLITCLPRGALSDQTMPNGTEPTATRQPTAPRQPCVIPEPFGIVRRGGINLQAQRRQSAGRFRGFADTRQRLARKTHRRADAVELAARSPILKRRQSKGGRASLTVNL
jgi:hypothetical protein